MSKIDATIFKAYDIRATVDRFTPAAARLIGQAAGSLALERGFTRFAVGRDGRLSSPVLVDALIAGLLASGMDVLDLGLAATPLLYYAANELALGCGAVVTGSHSPPDYNGIKLMLGGETIDGAALQDLHSRIEEGAFSVGKGRVYPQDVTEAYFAAIGAVVALARPLKVVVDCGNGVAGVFAPRLYRRMGCQVVALYCEVDGHFPHHHPDPQVPANLVDLQAEVIRQKADVGLAFDGDGDRLGVVTHSGQIIPGDRLLMLFAAAELARQPGHVLYDVKSSRLVSRWVAERGGSSEAIPTGHSHMKRALKATGALLAGELSGHFAFAGWGVDDALFAGAKLLQMIAAGLNLDDEVERMPQSLITPELQVRLDENGTVAVERIAAAARFPSAERVSTVDGLRIEYADGFGLIRASNTTPVLTLRIEADNAAAQQRIHDELAAAIAPLPMPVLD
ncbi:MAG: phosphomannomutase/phosphoglucomutase [Formivibrio sp.]|nr:phosphomannomutase/phosphoglucomutase [Formivibrio sp.]